ncbi:MAG: hypothetical protein ACTSR5_02625 [Promethearchaeota archaeon]
MRTILKLWIRDIGRFLTEQQKKIAWDDFRYSKIQSELSELYLFEKLSICLCLHCGHRDKDMAYRPDMKQWLCVECNSEFVYYDKLKTELQMSTNEIEEFFNRLRGDKGVGMVRLPRSGIKCGGDSYPLSKVILNQMGIKQEAQDQFLQLCHYYGGHCDCEIVFNALPRFLDVSN